VTRSTLSAIRRGLLTFAVRTALILAVGFGIAWAAKSEKPRPPRPAEIRVHPFLARAEFRAETARMLEAGDPWIYAEDARRLPALIDLLESDHGRAAGEAIARIFRTRGITDERGRPPVSVDHLDSRSYRRALRACLGDWYATCRDLLRSRPCVASPF
jgi:hypothetical protein